jgi:hypothetical protein
MHNDFGEPWVIRHANYYSDPQASADELLNDATEWLQYAYHSLKLLAELVDERDRIDTRRLPIMLEGIAAFVEMGTRCATQAHLRLQWQQVRCEAERSTNDDREGEKAI